MLNHTILLLNNVLIIATTNEGRTNDTVISFRFRSFSSVFGWTATKVPQTTMIVPVVLSRGLRNFSLRANTSGLSFNAPLGLHLLRKFTAILRCKRLVLVLEIWVRGSMVILLNVVVVFISSVIVRAIAILFVHFLHVAEVGRFVDLSNSAATPTHSITSHGSILTLYRLMVWRTASHVDHLIEWVVSALMVSAFLVTALLSLTSCTCSAHWLSEFSRFNNWSLVALGWDWSEWTCRHCSFLNGSDSLLQVEERVDHVIASLLVLKILCTLLLQTEQSLANQFKVSHAPLTNFVKINSLFIAVSILSGQRIVHLHLTFKLSWDWIDVIHRHNGWAWPTMLSFIWLLETRMW